jgi:6-phosphogluconolactonase (cycloisomerase 2 family)
VRTLHITGDWSNSGTSGDLIIDGCGHTLSIEDRAQIFVDTNVTLTLRNMTIKTGPKSLNNPAIQLASMGSKLTLDNVMFDLGADFKFLQGQIFIHDEVAVTGTSAFIYQSPVPSYITSGATWSFEYGTTFSVAPVTFTDCPFTVNNTYTNNNFIVLTDSSSALYLNSCSLKTTYTGLRLTKGMVLFDNRVAVDTMAGLDLASTATTPFGYVGGAATGTNPRALTWSPDGRFLAVVNENSNSLQVYRFNGSTAPTSVGGAVSTGNNPKTVAWSPDGRFIALTNYTDNTLQVYRFTGNSKPVAVGGLVTTDTGPLVLAWSSDGRFIASVNYTVSSLQIFRFQGSNAPLLVASAATGTNPGSVTWLPDGRFLAVGNRAGSSLQMYQFNGRSGLTSLSTIATGAAPYAVTCSPDGRFVGVVNYVDSTLQVYRFYGRKTPVAVGTTVDTPTGPEAFTWSPDGRFLVAAGYTAATLQAYRFNGVSKPTLLGSAIATGSGPYYVAWSSDGKFLAVAAYLVNAVQIFRCNYYFTGQPTQGFTNGMVFGDSAKGSNYNANVKVLAGAGVVLQGKVTDDSA